MYLLKKSLLLFVCLPLAVMSQEVLTGLQVNPVVRAKAVLMTGSRGPAGGLDTIPMTLPFFDDFREATVFPGEERWIDRYAFVNTDIPIFPVNRGAVTLDAINDSGFMYPAAVPGPTTFTADHLTSRYIRLDSIFAPSPRALTPADSVYLSFWYQPQGRAQAPHASDSLMLRFLVLPAWDSITPSDTTHIEDKWQEVWRTRGMALDTFWAVNNQQYFVQVMIPVIDTVFFKKTFRFQFYNFASLASSAEPSWQSNCSQWNLDNIFLDINRSLSDTVHPELTFIERPPPVLRNYAVMPFPQYADNPTNEMADTLTVLISNRDVEDHVSSYGYTMEEAAGPWLREYDGGEYNVKPFYTSGYVTYPPFAHPPVPYLFPVSFADSALFLITHRIQSSDGSLLADTMQAYQPFYNYYAYDDGTPDAGYGLTPAGSLLAYRFRLNKTPDTLRAVQFFFNRTLSGNNVQFFYLKVWNDANGKPDQVLYEDLVLPEFADSLNKFVTYHLDPPLKIMGTFYIGWEQTTDDNLNVGFDRYNNHSEQILFNVDGTWMTSAYSGSLMIRPVVGKPIPLGISNHREDSSRLLIYPNPATGESVSVGIPLATHDTELCTLRLFNIYGQEILQQSLTKSISIAGFAPGIYLVTLSDRPGRILGSARLIILR